MSIDLVTGQSCSAPPHYCCLEQNHIYSSFEVMEKCLMVFICLVSTSSICLVQSETIETWGELKNVRAIDHQVVNIGWFPFKIQNRTLILPAVKIYEILTIV